MARYEIDGVVLHHLLADNFKYETFCLYGEDEYRHGLREEMARAMLELPWNDGRSMEDMFKIIDEDGYELDQLIGDQIDAFWEGDKIYG